MSAPHLHAAVRHLCRVANPGGELSPDAELLARFAQRREEAAFELLVWRHAPMVWGVCRRQLPCAPDAEDAFQATFLALLRQAGSIGDRTALGAWLYRVAFRTALKARARAARRAAAERHARQCEAPDPADAALWCDVGPALDEEVSRLPERLRVPVVLCYLQGRSNAEAARQIGCPTGTVASRLARARDVLRPRLVRRGITLAAGLTVADAPAAPAALVRSTVRVATACPARAALSNATPWLAGAPGPVRAWVAALLAALGVLCGYRLSAVGPGPAGPERPAAGRAADAGPPATDLYGDPLPPGAVARLGTVRLRHGTGVMALLFAPDGRTLLSGGKDGVIRVWDRTTGKEVRRLAGHRGEVAALALSRDGKALVSAATDQTVRRWDVAAGREVGVFAVPDRKLTWVALAPDGKAVLSGEDGTARLRDAASGKELLRFGGETFLSGQPALSPDGRVLAGGCADGTVHVWDAATGKEARRFEAHPGAVTSVAFAPNGQSLATADKDGLRLWDLGTGKERSRLDGWHRTLAPFVFAPDGRSVAASAAVPGRNKPDYSIVLWDLAARKEQRRLGLSTYYIPSVAFAPDGGAVAAGTFSGTIHLWDVFSQDTGKELFPGGHTGSPIGVAFGPDGRTLLTGGRDWTLRLWDTATGKELRLFRDDDIVLCCALSPDGKTLISGTGSIANKRTPSLHVWDVTTGKELAHLRAHNGAVNAVAFAPDGGTFATSGWDRTVVLWQTSPVKPLRALARGRSRRDALAFSPNGRTLATAEEQVIRLHDVATGRERLALSGHAGAVLALAFSSDGRTLFSSSLDKTVRLWEVATGRERGRFPTGQNNGLPWIAVAPGGRLLASAEGRDPVVRLWDVATGRAAGKLAGHRNGIGALAFAPDGRRLATGAHDTSALVWDLGAAGVRVPPTGKLAPGECEQLWEDLGGEDAGRAHRAVWKLAGAPAEAVPLLSRRLRAPEPPPPGRIDRLVADLGSERFKVRQQAAAELDRLGGWAEPTLRRLVEKDPPLEVRKRVEELLGRLESSPLSAEDVRAVRAVEVLEHAGTREARGVLSAVADGVPSVRVTQEARDALQRLAP